MNVNIRQETEKDYKITEALVEEAFKSLEFSQHDEQFLVAKLRRSDAFIPELSIVAETDNEIIGHIMLTKTFIENENHSYEALALAPLSVLPEYQNKGIGSKLIQESVIVAKELGYNSVFLVGHSDYYPRFGFKPASTWGIKAPFKAPDEAFMVLELEDNSLEGVTGTVVFSKSFFE